MGASTTPIEAEFPVQRQLDAYNARDIDEFMKWWDEDCRYHEFPPHLLARGAAEIRARHIEQFKESNLSAMLMKRIVVENVVVDQEIVTRTFPDGPGQVEVLVIYEIKDGRIAQAWFKIGKPAIARQG